MKIGYARVSTRDQNLDLQLDALRKAGCERIYQDIASGSRSARPALDEMLGQLRPNDVLVIWKLDRMGRSLPHLVELVGDLVNRKVGLLSLNDPIDTTHAQGRFVFNLFASLAQFERELIRERTQAGLSSARARGRVGGRPKGLTSQAAATAMAAETLYRERRLSVSAIAKQLDVSKSTLYSYLRHRNVKIGPYNKSASAQPDSHTAESPKIATILLWLRIENNTKFGRGKKRAKENIERYLLKDFSASLRPSGQYELKVPYQDDQHLDKTISDLIQEIGSEADLHHCCSESDAELEGSDRSW